MDLHIEAIARCRGTRTKALRQRGPAGLVLCDRRRATAGSRQHFHQAHVGGFVGVVDLQLSIAGRPQKTPRSCTAVAVTLNGRALGRFVAFVGWREYRLRLPAGLVHAGANEVGFTAGAGERPARFGITYVRLAAERSAAD